ncbi:MAG: ABC transporter permease [Halobacteriota archaeon]
MTAILLNESRNLQKGAVVLSAVLVLLLLVFLGIFPAMSEEAETLQDAYPDYMLELMDIEEIHSIEGFVGGYVYSFLWILFAGMYFAYVGAGAISDDIRSRKMDLTLASPVTRESVLAQKTAALWVPLTALNVGFAAALAVGSAAVGEHIDPVGVAMLHLLGTPYLLVCAGIGLVLSVTVSRPGRAKAGALGLVFVLWLLEGVADMEDGYELLGEFTPSGYYTPSDILLREEYAYLDGSALLLAFLLLFAVAASVFRRRDV